MIDIESLKSEIPKEDLLCQLIETGLMGVVIDECCDEVNLEIIINAVYLYKRVCRDKIKVFAASNDYSTPYINKLMEGYGVTDYFDFLKASNNDELLTCFLGSETLITSDPESSLVQLAKEFYIPRICISEDKKGCEFADGVFYVNSDPAVLSAGLMIIRERKYTDDLSGYRRLV